MDKNIKHECAHYAYQCIENIIKNHNSIQKDYRSEVMSAGTKIHDAGLMQTLAFFCSKMKIENNKEKNPHFRKLTLHIMKWILREEKVKNLNVDTTKWDEDKNKTIELFEFLLNQSDEKMMHLTQEALEVITWLKRFADARLEKK